MTYHHLYSVLWVLQREASEQHLYTGTVRGFITHLPPGLFHEPKQRPLWPSCVCLRWTASCHIPHISTTQVLLCRKKSVPVREQNVQINILRHSAFKLQANPVIYFPNNTGAVCYAFLFPSSYFPFQSNTPPRDFLVYHPAAASAKRYGFWL